MSRTYKDRNKQFDLRHTEHKSGVKKAFKRQSNKKARRTPLTSPCLDMEYSERKVTIKIPQNIVQGSLPTLKEVEIILTFKTPHYTEVENTPKRLDIWEID